MTRPARALLSAQALRHNFGRVCACAPQAKVMAVIKANAYGHGLAWAARVLRDADGYAVASVEEGAELRAAQVPQPICLLAGFFDAAELPLIAQQRLAPVIHHAGQVLSFEQAKGVGGLDVWLKVDTGMHRIGFSPEHAADAAARLAACPAVGRVRWMSHFANADNRFDSATKYQIENFLKLVDGLDVERSLANSAGIVAWPASHLEWVRPGIMLYGASPLIGHSAAELNLKPAMTLETRLIAVHRRKKGDAVGYGGDWICPEDMPVGVAAIGYGDGYPRHAPPGTPVLVSGVRAPLIGRVSMDMITVDLRSQPQARVDDPVVLWGEGLPVDEISALAGTISYELLCCVTSRIPRVEIE
jgi:alanine racemase